MAAVWKREMLAATKVKMIKTTFAPKSMYQQGSQFHAEVVQNNGIEVYKKVYGTCKVLFFLRIRTFLPLSLLSLFSVTQYYFLFEYIESHLTRASHLALAKSIHVYLYFIIDILNRISIIIWIISGISILAKVWWRVIGILLCHLRLRSWKRPRVLGIS